MASSKTHVHVKFFFVKFIAPRIHALSHAELGRHLRPLHDSHAIISFETQDGKLEFINGDFILLGIKYHFLLWSN